MFNRTVLAHLKGCDGVEPDNVDGVCRYTVYYNFDLKL